MTHEYPIVCYLSRTSPQPKQIQGWGAAMDVAERWCECREVNDAICLLRESHVHSFARCNIWLVRGSDRHLLIDSGTGLFPLKPVLPAVDGRPLIALATHVHFDHIGALHEFSDRRARSHRLNPETPRVAPFISDSAAVVLDNKQKAFGGKCGRNKDAGGAAVALAVAS
jgi:glyoxylase-like metal-dependent hydrolase (beta-lactamase superfamily II)